MKTYYVYIMGSKTGTLYVGMTNDIKRRVYEHKNHLIPGFTDKYNVERLLYFETISDPASAINRRNKSKRGGAKRRSHLLIRSILPRKILVMIGMIDVASQKEPLRGTV